MAGAGQHRGFAAIGFADPGGECGQQQVEAGTGQGRDREGIM